MGISKADYFSILADAGRRLHMNFSLVYWEACNSLTGDMARDRLPDNVERLLVIQHDANYNNILYGDILKAICADGRLADTLTHNLPPKFLVIDRQSPIVPQAQAWSVPLWIYFTPLVLWIGWVVWQWGPWGKKKGATSPPACIPRQQR